MKNLPAACIHCKYAQVESYFRSVIAQVCSVKMILTAAHREKLTSADLSR
jgi:hypothetical protein